MCVGRILWILAVVPQIHTLETLVLGYPLSWALTSILFIVYYLHGGWMRRFDSKGRLCAGAAPGAARAPGVKAAHIA